ncbi:MAG TPA: HD domain-containing protein [Nitrospirae bacterium]|nr:HD domain-containing protein [Nitrospirota bacterium]
MQAIEVLKKYYDDKKETFHILLTHSIAVAEKALKIAKEKRQLNLNSEFIETAALLHDIGIFKTYAPKLGCYGNLPYICHGYLGREIVESEGLPVHALVCERHVGAGIKIEDIVREKFPIPHRDMTPQSLEEKLICYADKFFSKKRDSLRTEIPLDRVMQIMASYGEDKLAYFNYLHSLFG